MVVVEESVGSVMICATLTPNTTRDVVVTVTTVSDTAGMYLLIAIAAHSN